MQEYSGASAKFLFFPAPDEQPINSVAQVKLLLNDVVTSLSDTNQPVDKRVTTEVNFIVNAGNARQLAQWFMTLAAEIDAHGARYAWQPMPAPTAEAPPTQQ